MRLLNRVCTAEIICRTLLVLLCEVRWEQSVVVAVAAGMLSLSVGLMLCELRYVKL